MMHMFQVVLALTLMALIEACGGKKDDNEVATDSNKAAASANETTRASVTTGPAAGTSVDIPAGSIAIGSTLEIAPADQPQEFSDLGTNTTSDPVTLSGASEDGGKIVVDKPMTLNINISQAALAEVDQDNLCILGKTVTGDLLVWRKDLITVDGATAKISVVQFGTYQAAYCGQDQLVGFTDVSENLLESMVGDNIGIIGTYRGVNSCTANTETVDAISFIRNSTLTFDQFIYIKETFEGFKCEGTKSSTTTYHNTVSIKGDKATLNNEKEGTLVHYTITDIKVMFHTEAAATDANSKNYCGHSDWAVDSEKSCTDGTLTEKVGNLWQVYLYKLGGTFYTTDGWYNDAAPSISVTGLKLEKQ